MPSSAARNFHDKAQMKMMFRKARLLCARNRLVSRSGEALDFAREVGYPIVAKPRDGARSLNTFDDRKTLFRMMGRLAPSIDKKALLEEYIEGEEYSCDTVIVDQKVLWQSFALYHPTPLQAKMDRSIQWTALLPRELNDPQFTDIGAMAAKVLPALGMSTGFSHMEWFRKNDGTIVVSKIAARPPGAKIDTLLSVAHQVDFLSTWMRLIVLRTVDPLPARRFSTGVVFLRAARAGRIKTVRGFRTAAAQFPPMIVEKESPVIGRRSSADYEGDGYFVLKHSCTKVVHDALKRIAELVCIETE